MYIVDCFLNDILSNVVLVWAISVLSFYHLNFLNHLILTCFMDTAGIAI